ncbi:type II toxin-antitoxin system HipA family toxin [Pelomonas sp. P7]|uniref:Type II toxin-antitoxin system HipA family toxin n=1 Tax=Pelomonas caseinilytica TaxID=2906763 RepID=A0ABS8XIU9_9BURK|nr:type II toxin-antitoxin system HipA family toxin [Pelomonas sp. P7]MCE4538476.1 type II toxin-antitoxin system HipA family toxin [Pelomonas sp. P7]
MTTLPERIRHLRVDLNGAPCGDLRRESQLVFSYRRDDDTQPSVGLLMPPRQLLYRSSALFPVMDQNLPEGYLFERVRALYPKQPLTPMHLLGLIGENGIGRLGFHLPEAPPAPPPVPMSREQLLRLPYSQAVFDDLVAAYLSSGLGIAGVQPKLMLPDRASIPVPNLIVKAGSQAYPGLAANEFLCLQAASRAGIAVPGHALSDDGQLLILDRFDLQPDGRRLGFEDVAALMGLSVRDTLSDRKYHGSYETVSQVLKALALPAVDLARFFEQVAFTIMVRNGDGHLKNFGVGYDESWGARLAPMYDVVTTAIYRYQRWTGGEDEEDRTLALRLFAGRGQTRAYPTTEELLRFGRQACGVAQPAPVLARIAEALRDTLAAAHQDERIPKALLDGMAGMWARGMDYAR